MIFQRSIGWIYLNPHEAPKHRNAIARDLRSPKYRKRVVKSRKVYTRKQRALIKQED